MNTLLNLLVFFSPIIMIIGIGIKFFKISKMPVNVRWEIYPLPAIKREKCKCVGSYIEEVDWVKKKSEKNFLGEIIEPFKEMFFLHRLKKFNTYGLWPWSMALHWGIWFLFLWFFLVFIALFMENFNISNFVFVAYLSYLLGILGSLGLIFKRNSNKDLRLYTSGIDYFNLFFLLSIFGTGLLMTIGGNFINENLSYIEGIITFNLEISEFSKITIIHFLLFAIFLIYIPFSKFFHGPVKFFTFHKILWNDSYQQKGSSEETKISQQLNYKVRWAGPHILPEKSWLENAKNPNIEDK